VRKSIWGGSGRRSLSALCVDQRGGAVGSVCADQRGVDSPGDDPPGGGVFFLAGKFVGAEK